MKISKILPFAVCLVLALTGCKTSTQTMNEYAFSEFKTQCLGVSPSGIQMLRTWGTGMNKAKAIEEAKRNAVNAVIFDGIVDGNGECNKRPLVNVPNARERYEDYFNAFFREGGAYNKYVTLEEKRTSRISSKNTALESWSVVVNVNRTELKNRLIDDNVISK